jgi:hypothetical protein
MSFKARHMATHQEQKDIDRLFAMIRHSDDADLQELNQMYQGKRHKAAFDDLHNGGNDMANQTSQRDAARIDELLLLIEPDSRDKMEMEALVNKMIKQRRNKQLVVSSAMDELRVGDDERKSQQLCAIGEKAYADRKRLMNDVWTEINNGVSRDFVGSLHPSHTVRYK